LLARGTPMLLAGDELVRMQRGDNNERGPLDGNCFAPWAIR
jgi:hypothetical protein